MAFPQQLLSYSSNRSCSRDRKKRRSICKRVHLAIFSSSRSRNCIIQAGMRAVGGRRFILSHDLMSRTDLFQHIISPSHNTRRSLTILLWTDIITSQAMSLHASRADDRAQHLATCPVPIHQQRAPMVISRSRAAAASTPMLLHSSTRKSGIPWILSPLECLREVNTVIGRLRLSSITCFG